MTAVFVCHQYLHFWAASTQSPDVTQSGGLQFSNGQTLSIQKQAGNLNNHKICNGRDYLILAQENGTLVVQCFKKNGVPDLTQPGPNDLSFNITITIPQNTANSASTFENNEIQNLIEISSIHDPDVEITTETSGIGVVIGGVDGNTQVDIFT